MSKVVLLKCEEYNLEIIYKKLKWGLDQLGGIENIIPKEKKILLKPNFVVAAKPEEAATTHPVVFEAIAKILLEKKYTITYGDSPGYEKPEKVAIKSGIKAVADKHNIQLVDFVKGKKISYPDGVVCKQFDIANGILETDAIINLPKMKSHAFQRITGAIKNPFGAVIGFNKGAMHSSYNKTEDFAKMIVDLANYLKVDLHIMDGIVAMEGNGPRNGDPVKMNVLLLSTDPVALDTVFCKLVNLDHLLIPTITYGQIFDLGKHENIEIIGDDIEPLINNDFNIDRDPLLTQYKMDLSFLRKHVLKRPYIVEKDCVTCGICIKVCPLEKKALSFKDNDKTKAPIYDYDKCIRCYCCQEMCPHDVIKVKTPLIGKVLFATKLLK